MTDYVAYYRVSTPGQAHTGWEQNQAAVVAEYIASHGGKLVREFSEVGSAVGKKARPVFQEAVRLCKATGATMIVAWFDRFARNGPVALEAYEGLNLVACDIPRLTKATVAMYAAIGEREADLIKQRTKAGLAAAKARGKKLGGYRKGGFGDEATRAETLKKAAKARTAKADEHAMAVGMYVRQAQKAGQSLRQICKTLNDKGIRPVRGGQWYAGTVKNIISRLDALGV